MSDVLRNLGLDQDGRLALPWPLAGLLNALAPHLRHRSLPLYGFGVHIVLGEVHDFSDVHIGHRGSNVWNPAGEEGHAAAYNIDARGEHIFVGHRFNPGSAAWALSHEALHGVIETLAGERASQRLDDIDWIQVGARHPPIHAWPFLGER